MPLEGDGEITSESPPVIRKAVWKSITDAFWCAEIELKGLFTDGEVANYQDTELTMYDHTKTEQVLFRGIAADTKVVEKGGNNRTTVYCFSYGWHLSNQYVPDTERSNLVWSVELDEATPETPDQTVDDLFGGTSWSTITGVQPLWMIPVSTWGTSTLPAKAFYFAPSETRWQAAQRLADYCGYVVDEVIDESSVYPIGVFCDVDDIDTYMYIPSAVTFTKSTDKYVIDITVNRLGSQKFNKVIVTGDLNYHGVKFTAGIKEFTVGARLYGGSSGAYGDIETMTVISGTWAGDDAEGTIVLSNLHGHFTQGETLIDDELVNGEATCQEPEFDYEKYDTYTKTLDDGSGNKPREKYDQAPAEFDTEALIDARAQDLYDFYILGAYSYEAKLRKRCDLKLWQKVKFVGWSSVPESYMRIVAIRYEELNGSVTVTATLCLDSLLWVQTRMRQLSGRTDINAIEDITLAMLKQYLKINAASALRVDGEYITAQVEADGDVVIKTRAPGNAS